MKLPFDVGVKLVFRLLIPGLVLSLGYLPALNTLLDRVGWSDKFEYAYIPLVLVTGWLIVITDMRIYMLFEGRRYWPGCLWKWYKAKEERRCQQLQRRINDYLTDRREGKDIPARRERQYHEDNLDQLHFPIVKHDEFEAHYPTRLGNLLKAYEKYPWRVYGMSAVFYWPRLWLTLDKDLREELDNQQAVADSSVYTSLALYVSGAFWLIYAAGTSLQAVLTSTFPRTIGYLPAAKVTITEHLPYWPLSWALSLTFILLGYGVYRASLQLHSKVGDLIKSTFDNCRQNIDVSQIIDDVSKLTEQAASAPRTQKEKFIIAWRYLQYNLIECPNCFVVLTPKEYRQHPCPKQPTQRQEQLDKLSAVGAKTKP